MTAEKRPAYSQMSGSRSQRQSTHEYKGGVQVFVVLLGKFPVELVGLFLVDDEEICFLVSCI